MAEASFRSHRKSLWEVIFPYLLITPTLILIIIFTIYPTMRAVRDSLYRPPLTVQQTESFVGFQNYIDLFDAENSVRPDISNNFPMILRNTFIFSGSILLVSVPLGFWFAVLLNRRIPALGIWRFSLFYPSLLPLIGAASIWSFLYAENIGLINTVLAAFNILPVQWLGTGRMTLLSVIIVIIWKQSGYFMIFYLAGLQNIPRELYESAELEGANAWQQMRYLTLPLLQRTTLFVFIIAVTQAFQMVEQLQALGQGGPGESSNMILYYIFQKFPDPRNWGYINAMTVILLLMLMVFTVANFYFFEWRDEKDAA